MDTTNSSGKIIGALLAGAAIGGVLGILFAPDKGSETRKKIAGTTDDLSKSLKINSMYCWKRQKQSLKQRAKKQANSQPTDAGSRFSFRAKAL